MDGPTGAIAVDDCGNVMDSEGTTGQIHGSLAQGIDQARYETMSYDAGGQPLSTTAMDYPAPRATDLPVPELAHIVSPAPSNPLGAKGIGESGCIGFPPAMVNAVLDALRPLGVTHIDMPLDAGNAWSKITRAQRAPVSQIGTARDEPRPAPTRPGGLPLRDLREGV